MANYNQQWQDKIFPHLRSLRTVELSKPEYRINLITDSINKGSLYGGVATAIIFAVLLAKKNYYQLRIITRTEKAEKENIETILQANNITFNNYIECIFAHTLDDDWVIEDSPTDYYITTSWWTTHCTLKTIPPERIIYLLQEDERMFYPYGIDYFQCQQILSNQQIKFVINNQLLYQSLIASGLDNIAKNGLVFEPAFIPHYCQKKTDNNRKKKFFFYARPNNLRNLFFLGLEVIETAFERGILSSEEWDIYFVGKDLTLINIHQLKFSFELILVENLTFPEYIEFISDVDLGLSLMYTSHPSYPPLDLAISGAIVVTNTFGLKQDLSNYCQNIICKNLSCDELIEGIIEGINLVDNYDLRVENARNASLNRDWHQSFANVLNNLLLPKRDMEEIIADLQLKLKNSQEKLEKTQLELREVRVKFQKKDIEQENKIKELINSSKEKELELKNQLQAKEIALNDALNTIEGMESSKFWKLRKSWFNFKSFFKEETIRRYLPPVKSLLILANSFGVSFALRINKFKKDYIPSSENPDYQHWLNVKYPLKQDFISMALNVRNFAYKPVISIIMPTYNTPEEYLRSAIASVLDQVYPYWELCIADDKSTLPHVRQILEEYSQQEKRIKVCYRKTNGHISLASNSAMELATGEYIALLDHDDLITPHALYEVVKLLNQHPEADYIYTDEDKIDEKGKLREPYFKPDWCPDSFLARMYTCHFSIFRTEIIKEIGGFREGFEGSQDYDLVLRFTEKAKYIYHIPNILYHWRIHSQSTAGDSEAKMYAYEAAQKAIQEAIARRGESGIVKRDEEFFGIYHIRYQIKNPALVSIIIPTKDLSGLLNSCLESIFIKTTYSNYEVIVIDNGSIEPETQACFDYWLDKQPDKFSYYPYDIPFNYSKLNNYGVAKAKGEYLLFLNNDTEIITGDWLESMIQQAQRKSVGVVGCKLLYPDDTIQHAGVVIGLGGIAGHAYVSYPENHGGYFGALLSTTNYSAVTGACMMCRREVWEAVKGFEEELEVAFNDVDFCLKVRELGYYNLYLPNVVLHHYESKSRGIDDTPEKQARFRKEINYMGKKWSKIIDNDPCYNPNLTRNKSDYSINLNLTR